MKTRNLLIAILAITNGIAPALFAGEREAVVQIDGCTGFVVEGNLLVTAKHCQHPQTMKVSVQNQTVTARKIFTTSQEDGPTVFRLEDGSFESLRLANAPPKVGDAVYSLGYPGGHWARIEGEIIGGNGINLNYTNHRVATGNSGGPLLNTRGEVIGIALHVDANLAVHRSGFVGWKVTSDAVAQAKRETLTKNETTQHKTVVVVFSTENCLPCKQLEQDVQAGHFDDYQFRFVKWDRKSKRWSEPGLYQEFWETARPELKNLTFPTIWIKGTNKFRVGYNRAERGGLLGWLAKVVRHLLEGILGQKQQPRLNLPQTLPDPELDSASEAESIIEQEAISKNESTIQQLLSNIKILREDIIKTKTDLETFKQSGVIGKIKTIAFLKSDKKKTLEQVSKVKSDIDAIRNDFHEQPLQFLWGLFGLLSGLAQKRFLD